MRIKSFRVRNFKSIQDSGPCALADGVTVLAGKNESGKTSILEALEDFDSDRDIRESAQPISRPDDMPSIAITFELDLADMVNLLEDERPTPSSIELEITKDFPHQYSVDKSASDTLQLARDGDAFVGVNRPYEEFMGRLVQMIPNFILFSSFDDVFPSEMTISEARDSDLMQDLARISDLDLDLIENGTAAEKVKHREHLNVRMNDEYSKYWTQDETNLYVDWEAPNLHFFIKEDGEYYAPAIRSKGRQWHLAFYVRVTARSRDDVQNIILIDEPGLFLHASAQRDIVKKLESGADETPVIYATHSPYLIEPEHLDRIRLVRRTGAGTRITPDVHVEADRETLTPIMTAIGLEMTAGISNLEKLNNVVVEGPSDYYYLQALKEVLSVQDLNFVFGGGAGNMPVVGTILTGWGCRVVYLYDNDQGMKDGIRSAKKKWLIDGDSQQSISQQVGCAVEDLFSSADFAKFVLGDPSHKQTGSNSEYMKKSRRNKVIAAKDFLSRVRSGQVKLSPQTKTAARAVFVRLNALYLDQAQ